MSDSMEQEGLLQVDVSNENENATEESVPHRAEEETERKSVGEAMEQVAEQQATDQLEKPDYIQDKHWDANKGVKIEELANSHNELQKKMSMGGHKAPKEYNLDVLDGVDQDDKLVQGFLEWANQEKPTQEQFDKLVSMFRNSAEEMEQEDMIDIKAETEKLGPNAEQIIKSTKEWVEGQVQKGVFGPADVEEIEILGATAQGTRVLSKLIAMTGQQQIPAAPESIEGIASESDLYALVKDPRYKTDPVFRREVERKFNEAFPGVAQPRT